MKSQPYQKILHAYNNLSPQTKNWAVIIVLSLIAVILYRANSASPTMVAVEETPVINEAPVRPAAPVPGDFALYNPDDTSANKQYDEWVASGLVAKANELQTITSQPTAMWLTKSRDLASYIPYHLANAQASNTLPVFVLYNIPLRFCSGGGADTLSDYKNWIDEVAGHIGDSGAIIVIEPDSLALLDCINESAQEERIAALKYAIAAFDETKSQFLYLDAGHSDWVAASEMAERLNSVGIDKVRGFSLNVSNFQSDAPLIEYGQSLRRLLGGDVSFIIDTSRNGIGPLGGDWCNPPQRGLGRNPTLDTTAEGLDAYLWIKFPGESDGDCNGGPAEGAWWPEYALDLIRNRPRQY